MKKRWFQTVFLILSVFGLSFALSLVRDQVFGQQGVPAPAAQVVVKPQWDPPRWPVQFTDYDDPMQPGKKITTMTVVVPEEKRILVYRLEMGKVKLLSARNMQFDLQLDDFNAEYPTPEDLQRDLQRLKRPGPPGR